MFESRALSDEFCQRHFHTQWGEIAGLLSLPTAGGLRIYFLIIPAECRSNHNADDDDMCSRSTAAQSRSFCDSISKRYNCEFSRVLSAQCDKARMKTRTHKKTGDETIHHWFGTAAAAANRRRRRKLRNLYSRRGSARHFLHIDYIHTLVDCWYVLRVCVCVCISKSRIHKKRRDTSSMLIVHSQSCMRCLILVLFFFLFFPALFRFRVASSSIIQQPQQQTTTR